MLTARIDALKLMLGDARELDAIAPKLPMVSSDRDLTRLPQGHPRAGIDDAQKP